jgi:hypothetical protein
VSRSSFLKPDFNLINTFRSECERFDVAFLHDNRFAVKEDNFIYFD